MSNNEYIGENENEDPLEWLNQPATESESLLDQHTEGIDDEGELPVDPHALKPRMIGKSIMRVFQRLGGDRWLLEQAQENPKEFLGMLKTIVPKNLDIGFDTDIRILIAPRENVEPIGVQTKQHQLESNRKPIKLVYKPEETDDTVHGAIEIVNE